MVLKKNQQRYPARFVMNYGQMTQEEHEGELRNAQQAVDR